jgi:RHS repeat-associated protein
MDATGLIYLRARYYSPQTGRFFVKDPWQGTASQPTTLNPYQYALNNPIMNTDPSGSMVCLCGMDPETGLCHPCSDRYSFLPPFLAQTVSELGLSLNNPIVIAIIAAISCLSIMGNFLVREAPSLPDILPDVRPKIDPYGGQLITGERAGPVIWERGKTEPEHAPTPLGRDIIPRVTETPRPIEEWVVRGGVSAADTLISAYGPIPSMPGHFGFSVQYQPGKTVDELAFAGHFPHGQISYATADQLRSVALGLGYSIILHPTYGEGPGFHHDLEAVELPQGSILSVLPGSLAEAISLTFIRKPNPFPFK